jgi:hypothetical protein
MGVDAQMLVKTRTSITEDQVLDLAYRLYGAFYGEAIFDLDRQKNDWGGPHHCLSIVKKYGQDGPTLYPKKGEIFIEVHLLNRYYGVGYERGPLTTFCAIATWLEFHIHDAEIFYGGDSSGILAEKFDKEARQLLLAHFYQVGHLSYQSYCGDSSTAPICTFCQKPMLNCGGGPGAEFYRCYGCNEKVITEKGQPDKRWHDRMDFFEKSKEV